ncbi:uncharacterized protein LOC125523513 [Triticum urartu]|uniref:uncharacterized protein LOC125523513 n=1 Tax=Triticum urartu TaxID=4572 RepID=UPI002044C276|nr:uncharacterized protein LOC125523513 [Triticum urartu]
MEVLRAPAGLWPGPRGRPNKPTLRPRPGTATVSGTLKYPALAPNSFSLPFPPPRRSPKKPRTHHPHLRLALRFSLHRLCSPAIQRRRRPMDRFHDGHHVRLRSRVIGKYLHADDDVQGVSLRARRASLNQAWTVHIYNGNGVYLLLYSATYGRYLATTATRAPRGHRGFRAGQREYDQPEVQAIMWRAVRSGFGDDVLLRDAGGRYLRANGKYRPWNTGVTVEASDNVSAMMYWTVEPIPARDGTPGLPGPIQPVMWRQIRYMVSEPDGPIYTEYCWSTFQFRGRSVFHLRNEVARHTRFVLEGRQPFDLVMCVQAGRHGRLTPLFVDLPRGDLLPTFWIVVFLSGTPAYNALRHPNVDAE